MGKSREAGRRTCLGEFVSYLLSIYLRYSPEYMQVHTTCAGYGSGNIYTAFTKLSQLKESDALGGWLKRILVHHCYRALQKEKLILKQEASRWSEAWWENDWDQKLENLSNKHQIYASLAPLSETLRSVLLLRYFSD